MRIRHLLLTGACLPVPFGFALPPAGADEATRCAVTDVGGIDGFGRPTDDAGEITAVVASISGDLPVDAGSTLSDAVGSAMDASGPVWTTFRSTLDGVDATVSPLEGALPPDLARVVEEALGCVEAVAAAVESSPAGDPSEGDGVAAPEPAATPPVTAGPPASAAAVECEITAVLPVDATGTVVSTVADAEGVLVSVTGPLPVGAADTVAGVVQTVSDTAGPLVPTVVETVETVEVTVTGVSGPLPADLSATLADALGCRDVSSSPATPGPSDPAAGSPPSRPETGETSIAGAQVQRSGGSLARTGGPVGLVGGSALLGAGVLLRLFRRLVMAGKDRWAGIENG